MKTANKCQVYTAVFFAHVPKSELKWKNHLKKGELLAKTINGAGRVSDIEEMLNQLKEFLRPTTPEGVETASFGSSRWVTGKEVLEALAKEEEESPNELATRFAEEAKARKVKAAQKASEERLEKRKEEAARAQKEREDALYARAMARDAQRKEVEAFKAEKARQIAVLHQIAEEQSVQKAQKEQEAIQRQRLLVENLRNARTPAPRFTKEVLQEETDDVYELGGRGYDGYAIPLSSRHSNNRSQYSSATVFSRTASEGPFTMAQNENVRAAFSTYGRMSEPPSSSSNNLDNMAYTSYATPNHGLPTPTTPRKTGFQGQVMEVSWEDLDRGDVGGYKRCLDRNFGRQL